MIAFVLIWFLQDIVQVMTMGFCLTPDFFLMSVLFSALAPNTEKERQCSLVWIAFAGGLLWDLRWTNLPGMTAALNSLAVAAACFLWSQTPAQGRSASLFGVTLLISQLVSSVIYYLLWTVSNQVGIRQLVVQLLLSILVIVITSLLYWRVSDRHV